MSVHVFMKLLNYQDKESENHEKVIRKKVRTNGENTIKRQDLKIIK